MMSAAAPYPSASRRSTPITRRWSHPLNWKTPAYIQPRKKSKAIRLRSSRPSGGECRPIAAAWTSRTERDADEEEEEREDHVIEVEAAPLHVTGEVGADLVEDGVVPLLRDLGDEVFAADDPEHVETAQGVQRKSLPPVNASGAWTAVPARCVLSAVLTGFAALVLLKRNL